MKQSFHVYFICFLLFVLLLISSTSARLLLKKQGEGKVKANGLAKATSSAKIKEEFPNLMGSEECDVKDEECLRRRMVADAHLDYIYTQHNKP